MGKEHISTCPQKNIENLTKVYLNSYAQTSIEVNARKEREQRDRDYRMRQTELEQREREAEERNNQLRRIRELQEESLAQQEYVGDRSGNYRFSVNNYELYAQCKIIDRHAIISITNTSHWQKGLASLHINGEVHVFDRYNNFLENVSFRYRGLLSSGETETEEERCDSEKAHFCEIRRIY